jgi:predicted TIM-barrel fold metal-dependent hydrolase
MKKFDAHVHILPQERLSKLAVWYQKQVSFPVELNVTPEGILNDLKDIDIVEIINMVFPLSPGETESLNQFSAEFARSNAEIKIHPFASLHPENKKKEDIMKQAFFELGLMGLKFHPLVQQMDINDPSMETVWSCCEMWNKPVFVHTGFEYYYESRVDPSSIKAILKRHPELPLVLSHLLFPDLELAFDLARQFKEVYLDYTGIMVGIEQVRIEASRAKAMIQCLKDGIKEFPDRIIFGSDYPVSGASLEKVYKSLEALKLDDEEEEDLTCWANKRFIDRFRTN